MHLHTHKWVNVELTPQEVGQIYKFMTGMSLFWEENKRHTKLYVFGEEKMCKTENHCLINKAHYKNVYILDIKQKTFKVL